MTFFHFSFKEIKKYNFLLKIIILIKNFTSIPRRNSFFKRNKVIILHPVTVGRPLVYCFLKLGRLKISKCMMLSLILFQLTSKKPTGYLVVCLIYYPFYFSNEDIMTRRMGKSLILIILIIYLSRN